MQILTRSLVLIFALLIITPQSYQTFSQPPYKAKERIRQMKKMKLIDILDLKEQEADRFIIKYNSWEKKLEAKKELIDNIVDDLMKAVKRNSSDKELKKLSNDLIILQTDFHNFHLEKLKAMKEFLNTKNYAKYLVFEEKFYKELNKMMMRGRMGRGRGPR